MGKFKWEKWKIGAIIGIIIAFALAYPLVPVQNIPCIPILTFCWPPQLSPQPPLGYTFIPFIAWPILLAFIGYVYEEYIGDKIG